MLRTVIVAIAALQLTVIVSVARAQPYPNKAIHMIVGYAPGGGVDIIARMMAPQLQTRLGQPVIVDNRPGAGGNIATELTAKAAPDGYTLLMAGNTVVISPFFYEKLSFDVARDLTGVAIIATAPVVLVVHPDLPVRSVPELIAYAKSNPGKLSYSTPGIGTPQHLAAELFKSLTKTDIVHIPYKSGALAMNDLVAGQVQLSFSAIINAQPFIQSGRVRALATGEPKHSASPGTLPMIADAVPGYEVSIWFGILAPANTPKAIMDKLNRELATIVQLDEVKEQMTKQGYTSNVAPPERMNEQIRHDLEKWARVVKQAGLKPE